MWIGTNCRKFLTVKGPHSSTTKAAGIDYILDAQKKGEIDEDNVLHMIENVNSAGTTILTCRPAINCSRRLIPTSLLPSLGRDMDPHIHYLVHNILAKFLKM